ncbi:MAG: hypothetical protein HKN03_09365 [Acidimicrobiales bacterium]|nr:hypothetical protein [Acidimicrobiales bacterium]
MRQIFSSQAPVQISARGRSVVRSTIEVDGFGGPVVAIGVRVDIRHSYTADLVVILENPVGERVLLVSERGGEGDDFFFTTFEDQAPVPITAGEAPFSGRFRPEGSLETFAGGQANGTWTLLIADTADQDGGELRRWDLEIEALSPAPPPVAPENILISIRFGGGLTPTQQKAFQFAAARWSQVITSRLPDVMIEGERVTGVRIDASGARIDGPAGILGQAGPVLLRPGSMLPATGVMQFDSGDLAQLERRNGLIDVIIHEMGHVLGIGTLWSTKRLIRGSGTDNPVFVGANAQEVFGVILDAGGPTPVPIANTGGAGTREGHWRESVFGNELMTGFLNDGPNPLSALTIASLADLGYEVNEAVADRFTLPSRLDLAMMGIWAEPATQTCCTLAGTMRPVPQVLPESAVV